MTLRKAHGARADSGLRVELLPPDEQPKPVAIDLANVPAPLARSESGKILTSEDAKRLGARGGLMKAAKRRLLESVGLVKLAHEHNFHDYWKATLAWTDAASMELALACGGSLGPGPKSMVGSAGALLAGSRYFSDLAMRTDDLKLKIELFKTAGKLADQHRQALLTAYEYGNRIGEALRNKPTDPFAAFITIAAESPTT